MSKQIDDKINKIFTEEDKKAQKIIDDNTNIGTKIINPKPVPSVTPTTPSNTIPEPSKAAKTIINEKSTTVVTDGKTTTDTKTATPTNNNTSPIANNLIKKIIKATTK